MGIFAKLFGRKTKPAQEAVLIHLDGQSLPDSVYAECDLATIEDRLIKVIRDKTLGEFDGNEVGPERTTLYLYGPDAEKLFSGIESTLKTYPLCQNAVVVIRRGPPGAPQRTVTLPRT